MYVGGGGGGGVPEGISAILIHTKAQAIFGFDIFKNSIFFFLGGGGLEKLIFFYLDMMILWTFFWGHPKRGHFHVF